VSGRALGERNVEGEAIETRLGSHVEEIMTTARRAAAQLQAEVERASAARAAEIETAAARRAHAVRTSAEREAERVHAQTRIATQQYVAASRRLVDEFAAERMRRIAQIGDTLAEQAGALTTRLARTDEVARQLDELRATLGAACERIAIEGARAMPDLPELPDLPPPPAITAGAGPAAAASAGDELDVAAPPSLEQRLARATGRTSRHTALAAQQRAGAAPADGVELPR
jgi:hypothetical protein